MSKPVWNDRQLAAIEARGSNLLVAAAAGSGKTAVLVERLLRRVTEDGIDADRFLVVTFTRAAASEMLAKFTKRLTEAVAAAPDDRRLRRQLRRLSRAKVTTVHGFCASLLREHFQAVGLPPDFRVADETETAALRERALDELIDARYEAADPNFLTLVDALAATRDDKRLVAVVRDACARMNAHPDPDAWARYTVRLAREAAENDPAATPYGEAMLSDARNRLRYHAARYASALAVIDRTPALTRYRDTVEGEAETIGALLICMDGVDWDAVRDSIGQVSFSRLPPVKNAPEEEKAQVAAVRDEWKKAAGTLREDFPRDAASVMRDARAVLPVTDALMGLVIDFDAAYTDLKRRRGVVDFADLEHLTLRLLRDTSGNPTALARELAGQYAEILVDEYQDTNAVQDAIFASLARDNLFMVGDMKQSIYRFRLADPAIFLEKYNTYPDAAADGMPRRVILSQNYRSRAEVLNAANRLFTKIMSPSLGELSYTEREYLNVGRTFPEVPVDSATELLLIGASGTGAAGGADDAEDAEDVGDAEESLSRTEADYVACRIAAMVREGYPVAAKDGGTRPVGWGDFAILLRSFGPKVSDYAAALKNRGIPAVVTGETGDLFSTPEVGLVISLLTCVDNPRQDIALAAAMRAPMFAFTADELVAVRVAREGTFWEAVFSAEEAARECAENPDGADSAVHPEPSVFIRAANKAREMLDTLETLRKAAETMPLGRFLWHMATKLEIFSYVAAMDNAAVRLENLYTLFSYAYRYENAGYRGLYRFLRQLKVLAERGTGPETAGDMGESGAVRLMSVHKSKGLQFPVVFLCGCGGRFNGEIRRAPVLLHPKLGLGLRRRETRQRVEYPTLAQNAIRKVLWREQLSEEMRVLYVAMTRAEEKLILTAAVRDPARTLATYRGYTDALSCSPRALANESGMLGWLLRALLPEVGVDGRTQDGDWLIGIAADIAEPAIQDAPDIRPDILPDWSGDALDWTYPYGDATRIPSKLTATELARGLPDWDDAEELPALRESVFKIPGENAGAEPARQWTRPQFIGKRGLSPAERGTALHLAMQFCRYERVLTRFDCQMELARLAEEDYLTQEQADAVDPDKILRFFHSPLGERLRRSADIKREFKFSLPVSPTIYTEGPSALKKPEGDDAILLQGVLDCCFLENGAYVIVDFKTDAATDKARALARYKPQLTAYAHALTRITGKPVRECVLYLFSTGETASYYPESVV
ncbi:MAG: helicase-exonuclease AddAB subunit AddA [Clostridiaceae bacterium]|nr:helicase-exonuclease AddAB subunit AddA [Clostridiaceae bacterium]